MTRPALLHLCLRVCMDQQGGARKRRRQRMHVLMDVILMAGMETNWCKSIAVHVEMRG